MEFKDPHTPLDQIPVKYRGAFGRWRKIKNTPLKDRFWPHVDVRDSNFCWNFIGKDRGYFGYGIITLSGKPRVRWLAHRLAWTLVNGEIPKGLNVCHKCDNPPCCNPNHLFLGTQAENVIDMISKGRAIHPVGEKCHNAKITERQVIQIRAMKGTATHVEIAKLFEVSKSTIGHIMTKRKWKHIP